MNVYITNSHQKHCVVADSMEEAVRLWKEKYKYEPESLELFSKYVIVQGLKP